MKNTAVKYGILGGVSVVAYFLVFYFIRPQLMLEPAVQWVSLLVYFMFMLLAARQMRLIKGDEIFTFREAMRPAFLTFVIISTIYYIFNYLLYHFDPTMIIYEKEIVIRNMHWLANVMGQDLPEQELQKFRGENQYVTIGNSIFGLLRSFIGGFILALPVAAVVRR